MLFSGGVFETITITSAAAASAAAVDPRGQATGSSAGPHQLLMTVNRVD